MTIAIYNKAYIITLKLNICEHTLILLNVSWLLLLDQKCCLLWLIYYLQLVN